MAPSLLLPPETVRGMTTLDKTKFDKLLSVPVLEIGEASMSFVIAVLKPYLLKLEKFKPVQPVPGSDAKKKLVFLNPDLISSFDSFGNAAKSVFGASGISEQNFRHQDVRLSYDNWKCHDIVAAILPPELSFSGFSVIGSIVHVNLKGDLLAYKDVIGQVLLEKMKNCKSVVRKTKSIESTFRNFEMEVLAGGECLETEVKENGCLFRLNFAEVYWNPRLHDEHSRIVRKLRDGDVLYDVFCGIGPFAVPAARVGCEVLANDLNPRCCHWLRRNLAANKVAGEQVRVFNEPGDEFIRRRVRDDLLGRVADARYATAAFHVTMNLPATAVSFLPAFVGLFDASQAALFAAGRLPVVHLYCFVKSVERDPKTEARNLVERALKTRLAAASTEEVNVRNVAPNKDMIRVSFRMPVEVLCRDASGDVTEKSAAVSAVAAPAVVKRDRETVTPSDLAVAQKLKMDAMEWECNGADAADIKNTTADDEAHAAVVKRPKLA